MDLTQLENLTTSDLRSEAERLGVPDTYAMSRGQLLQAIRDQDRPPSERPSGLLGKVVGFAKWALQAAGEARVESEPPDPEVSAEATAPSPVPALVPSPAAAAEAPAEPIREAAGSTREEPVEPPTEAAESQSGPPSRPPAGVFSNHGSLFEEPIPTRTMARILAEQGHFKRSLAIYAKLLDEEPADSELLEEAAAVREEARARRSQAPP